MESVFDLAELEPSNENCSYFGSRPKHYRWISERHFETSLMWHYHPRFWRRWIYWEEFFHGDREKASFMADTEFNWHYFKTIMENK